MTATVKETGIVPDRYPTRKQSETSLIFRRDPVVYGSAGAGPIADEELRGYDESGFLELPELLSAEELGTCQAELERLRTDEALKADERSVVERSSNEIRSVFEIHKISEPIAKLVDDPRVVGRARQLLGSDVYVHQSRADYKPGFGGGSFYWHSDFETWHAEDGMPGMRAVSVSIALTDNHTYNGCLMIMPGSHKTFVSCLGETPAGHHRGSPREQELGTPDSSSLTLLAGKHGIHSLTGRAGSAVMFDCNCMHGSNGNITPFPRSNISVVFNSVDNTTTKPYAAPGRRPPFIASRDFTPVP